MKSKIPLIVGTTLALSTVAAASLLWVGSSHEKNMINMEESPSGIRSTLQDQSDIKKTGTGSVLGERESKTDSENIKRKRYDLLASVLKHDLNIMIADDSGNAVSGKEFHVYLESSDGTRSEYADHDKDGVIHALDLQSGKYTISLIPTDEYRMSDPVEVKVREEVAYSSIARIIQLIKSEDDVDTEKEDTANQREEDDGSLLEAGAIDLEGGTIGIDVSRYNKEIDWEMVKKSGVEFAIIRLGYRGSSSGVLVEDSLFKKNYEEAVNAGIKIGVYFVTQAVTEAEAEEEAEMVAALADPSKLSAPVFLDVESSGGRGDIIDKSARTKNINAFCRKAEELGFKAGVYANKKWFTKNIDSSLLEDWVIWLAQYKVRTPDYEGHYDIWQYSSKGHVDGIDGYVDLNLNLTAGE